MARMGLTESSLYPIIAGQYSDYLNQALIDYKSGARKNAVMGGIAATLTKEEMVGLARYFSSPAYSTKRQK